jgi:pimeloyl-ACP methyl ester carboxylesterase
MHLCTTSTRRGAGRAPFAYTPAIDTHPQTAASRHRISPAEWAAAGYFVDFRGHAIFVLDSGPRGDEALLLIHGFPTSSWDWEGVWPTFAARSRVLTFDMLGFGLSAKPRGHAYSIFEQADLAEHVLAAQGIASYHVLAHDYGDTVAQELLARSREPGRRPVLRSVAFLNGGLFPETHRPALVQQLLRSPLGPAVARLTTRTALASNMRRIFGPGTPPDDDLIDGFWELMQTNGGRAVMHRLIRYIDERRTHRERWVRALQHGEVPLTLIDGAADPISGAHMAVRFGELVPSASVTLLDGIGHYPQVEAPVAVLEAYSAFRAQIRAART